MRCRVLLILLISLSTLLVSAASAQTVCRPADSLGAVYKDEITRYATARYGRGDAVVRDSIRLPAVTASQVTWVTTESICKKANTAYQQRLANNGGSPFSGRVYVLKVGTTRYVATDPAHYFGTPTPDYPAVPTFVIMDTQYRPLSLF